MSEEKSLKEPDMESAIKAFKDWRSHRKKLCRIPDGLWEIAANLYPRYPISIICENLGLNWGTLKKKIDQLSLNSNPPVNPPKSPSFVELKLNSQEQAPSMLLNPSPSHGCAIELTKSDGTVMKIFACKDAPLNVLELFQSFLDKSE